MDAKANYVVEKNVRLTARGRPPSSSYPFSTMEVGDSFALTSNDTIEIERIRSAASWFGKRHPPMKFGVRLDDHVARTYRCWRIA